MTVITLSLRTDGRQHIDQARLGTESSQIQGYGQRDDGVTASCHLRACGRGDTAAPPRVTSTVGSIGEI